jgi:predicted nuclease with TOPRIM domain
MRLGRHGDASVVAKDVASIASQQLPRNTIVEHLRRKFPLLESGEVNDVIVAAHLHLGKSIPQLSDMHEQDREVNGKKDQSIKSDNNRAPPDWFKAKV